MTATLGDWGGGAVLCGCVAIQAKMPATKVHDTDTEARMADQLIRLGSLDLLGSDIRQGVKHEGEWGSGGGIEGTAKSS